MGEPVERSPKKKRDDSPEEKFVTKISYTFFALSVCTAVVFNTWSALGGGPTKPLTNIKCGMLAGIAVLNLLQLRFFGLTLYFKVYGSVALFSLSIFSSVTGRIMDPWHLQMILVLDFVLVLTTEEDALIMGRLSTALLIGFVLYSVLHNLSVSGLGPDIHPISYDVDFDLYTGFFLSIVPCLLNFILVRSYGRDLRAEAKANRTSVQAASDVGRALVDFDLDKAHSLMACMEEDSPIFEPLVNLIHNLRAYRPFLPAYLFPNALDSECEPTNRVIAEAMSGKSTSWSHAKAAVERLRDPDYSLNDFHADVEAAFPELKLYRVESSGSLCSSGFTGLEEYQRTLGALYSVYCITRLDIDGKDVFTFGVDVNGKPVKATCGDNVTEKKAFYRCMDWKRILELFERAGLLNLASKSVSPTHKSGMSSTKGAPLLESVSSLAGDCDTGDLYIQIEVNTERMIAFLALTAIHDIMKNPSLSMTVHRKHAPYQGVAEGCRIHDHDLALRYVMEHFPGLLPSFHGLGPGQRAAVFFSQGKMGFNNGWLVQGEAPPGALFSSFKEVISVGGASESDISFYFAHWLTDLAGAEPFGTRPWPGSEKFALKFPLKVLRAFLDSFSYVGRLHRSSEVEVMEEYLQGRWQALDLPGDAVPEDCAVASGRLALMAQGFELAAVVALGALPRPDRDLLAAELARTGLREQFASGPADVRTRPAGPALLVYYAPALIQKAGAAQASGALLVLAAVCRAARELFPLEAGAHAVERTVVIRIEALKVLTPFQIGATGPWLLRRVSPDDAVAVHCGPGSADSIGADVALIDLPELGLNPPSGAGGVFPTLGDEVP